VGLSRRLNIALTGATSGIGRELSEALVADGHGLFVCARTVPPSDPEGRVFRSSCDVTDERQVLEFLAQIGTRTDHLDVLINCAGSYGAIGPLGETESGAWYSAIQVNLFGTYLMIKHALPLLHRSKAAQVINFSGGGALSPLSNYSAYACAKAAVVRLTECAALELRPSGIRVNAVAPGFVATPIHQATLQAGPDRAGEEMFAMTVRRLREGASARPAIECVRFLLSDDSGYLTGKTISANFDPWRHSGFQESLEEINQSELFTMRRIGLDTFRNIELRHTAERLSAATACDRPASESPMGEERK
jgi:NAD(P)-dependent dehydrogenase (short-subunit alcohol dehydrogenase family)